MIHPVKNTLLDYEIHPINPDIPLKELSERYEHKRPQSNNISHRLAYRLGGETILALAGVALLSVGIITWASSSYSIETFKRIRQEKAKIEQKIEEIFGRDIFGRK